MKKLILLIAVLCVLVTSCGGEPTENLNYTHYNVVPSETTSITANSKDTANRTSESKTFTAQNTTLSKNNNQTSEKTSLKTYANPKNTEKGSSADNKINNSKNYSKKVILSKQKGDISTLFSSTVYNTVGNNSSEETEKSEFVLNETEQTTALEPLKDTDTGYITKTGDRYHRKGCRYLAKSCIGIIVGEAKEKGYTPCKVCKP